MPSIPQSLLWISLVVLWLFVLVPMLISKRDAVRRTSDVALATRVLNDGRARLLRRKAPAAGHASDPDWRPSDENLDDDLDETSTTSRRDRATVGRAGRRRRYRAGRGSGLPRRGRDRGGLRRAAGRGIRAVAGTKRRAKPTSWHWISASSADRGARRRRSRRTREPHRERIELDGSDDEYEYVADSSGLEAPSDTELQLADSLGARAQTPVRVEDRAAVSARKYKFRKRMLTVMAVLVVASAVAAVHAGRRRCGG